MGTSYERQVAELQPACRSRRNHPIHWEKLLAQRQGLELSKKREAEKMNTIETSMEGEESSSYIEGADA